MYFWLLKHPLNTENAKVNVITRACIMSKEADKYDGDFIYCILNPYIPFLHDEKGTKHGQYCAGKYCQDLTSFIPTGVKICPGKLTWRIQN